MFKGLRILEFANVLAGPAVGMFFAELGAEVIKIENPKTQGDMTRSWKLPSEDPKSPKSAYYHSVNYGKTTLFLDIATPEHYKQLLALLPTTDIVISNFKTSAAKKLKADFETLRAYQPKLIYAQLYAYSDPEDPRPAFDVALQAEAGFLYMTGEPGRAPVKMPVALIDILAAHQLKEAILLALLHSERTGEGSFVSTSLLEAAIASLANQATNWLMAGHLPQPMGSQHPNIAPYGDIYTCGDGKPVVLAVGTEGQFAGLCRCLDTQHLMTDKRFATNTVRVKNRKALHKHLAEALAKQPVADWLALFAVNNVPASRIRSMQEVFEMPEAQNMILEQVEEDGSVSQRVATVAFRAGFVRMYKDNK